MNFEIEKLSRFGVIAYAVLVAFNTALMAVGYWVDSAFIKSFFGAGLPEQRVTTVSFFAITALVFAAFGCSKIKDFLADVLIALSAVIFIANLWFPVGEGVGVETVFTLKTGVDPSQLTMVGFFLFGVSVKFEEESHYRLVSAASIILTAILGGVLSFGFSFYDSKISYGMAINTMLFFVFSGALLLIIFRFSEGKKAIHITTQTATMIRESAEKIKPLKRLEQ